MAAAARAERERIEREQREIERRENAKRDRIDLLIQKRVFLEGQIDDLRLQIVEEGVDVESLIMRGTDVETIYRKYLEDNSELVTLDRDANHAEIVKTMQINYYNVMAQLKRKTQTNNNQNNNNNTNNSPSASFTEQQVKLPDFPLPKFNGKYEEWFTFKDKFTGIIHSSTKINEVSKLFALKNCLIEDAQGKLELYREITGEYQKAWNYLEECYEVKRLIVESHWRAIEKLPVLEKETNEGLTKLVDGLLQHRTCLERLQVEFHPIIAVQILQSRLPKYTLKKWEESISLDELPSLEKIVEFIKRMAVCASRNDKRPNPSRLDNHKQPQSQPQSKKMRHDNHKPTHQVLTTETSFNCTVCRKEKHPLFKCDVFRNKNLKEKYDIIKRANVCEICLLFHKNECTYGNCRICGEKHNKILHPRRLNRDATTKAEVKEKAQPSTTEN